MNTQEETATLIESSTEIDEIDKMILNELVIDSRISYSDLAEKVHLSRVSVRERMIKLKESGVIMNYTIFVDSSKIGLDTSVFFDIKTETSKIAQVAVELAKFKEITVVYQTTGNTSLHVHAQLKSIESLGEFMHKKLYNIDGITNIISHVLLKRYKYLLTCN